MQNTIFTSMPIQEFQNAISEAVRLELSNLNIQTPPEKVEFITRKETAQILGISLVTLNEWTKTGTLQGYRIGSRVRYKKTEIENSLQKMKTLRFGRTA